MSVAAVERYATWASTGDHGRPLDPSTWPAVNLEGECSRHTGSDLTAYHLGGGVSVYVIVAGATGGALYVGVTTDLMRRLREHATRYEWARGGEGALAAYSTDILCCRRHAMQAERQIQVALRPTYNKIQEALR